MKILHMADVHLGAEPDIGSRKASAEEQWQAFEQAIQAAEEEQVDLVLIAGDLFHRQPLKKELKEVNAILTALTRAKVVLMAGNHDYLSRNSFYRAFPWSENISFFSSEEPQAFVFPELRTAVYGFSYEQREIKEHRYEEIEKREDADVHILLCHGGDESHIPIRTERLSEMGFDYIAMGHIHKPKQIIENRMIMAGALQPIDHEDEGSHGYWIVDIFPNRTSAMFYPIKMREYVTVELEITEETTGRQIQRMAQEAVAELESYQIPKIQLQGICDPQMMPDFAILCEQTGAIRVKSHCTPNYDFEKLKKEYENQIVEHYIRILEEMPQTEVSKRALYLGVDALVGDSNVY